MPIVTLTAPFSPADAWAALDADGVVILSGLITPAQIAAVKTGLTPLFAATPHGSDPFSGHHTKRVGGLVRKLPASHDLATEPTVLTLMDHLFRDHCDCLQLNVTQAIALGPKETAQPLHRDDDLYPFNHDGYQVIANCIWAMTPFTEANGATVVAPGSHRWPKDRVATSDDLCVAEMDAGSVVIYLGSTLHGGGANHTKQTRVGIVMGYALGWVRQMENQYLAAPPEIARNFSEPMQRLIGYQAHRPNLGWHECRDPMALLREDDPTQRGAEDMFNRDHYDKLERNLVTAG